jgi:hypothetical protein
MRRMLLILLTIALCGTLDASEREDAKVATVVVHNPAGLLLSVETEHTSDVFFDRFETKKKHDTLYFESSHAFRLLIGFTPPDKERVYTTFVINCGEYVVLECRSEGVKVVPGSS